MIKRIIFFLAFALLLVSCASKEKILYLQGEITAEGEALTYQNTLQPDDAIFITVTAEEPELAAPYNMLYVTMSSSELRNTPNNEALITYLIDQEGYIDFPVLGKIKLAGLTRIETEKKIKKLLEEHIINPGVTVRTANFKVAVLGEVSRPGTHTVDGDRVTFFEALSAAGDMTIYGLRKQVTIIREKDGVKTVAEVDLTDPEFIKSEYYYLAHNDVIYVKPNKTRVNSSAVGPNLTLGLSALSLLVTIIALSTR